MSASAGYPKAARRRFRLPVRMSGRLKQNRDRGATVSKSSEHAEIRAVMDGLRRIVQTLRVSARAAERRHGISGAQLFVLHQLVEGTPRSINELAALTFTHQSSVSTVVSRLVDAGYVVRSSSEDDARRSQVALTPRGRALLRKAPEPVQAHLIAGLRRLPSKDRRFLARALSLMAEEAGAQDAAPRLLFDDEARRQPKRRS